MRICHRDKESFFFKTSYMCQIYVNFPNSSFIHSFIHSVSLGGGISFEIKYVGTDQHFQKYLFIWLHQVLVGAHRILSCGMQYLSSSLTRDWTRVPCTGNAESQPLDHQGSPLISIFLSNGIKIRDVDSYSDC